MAICKFIPTKYNLFEIIQIIANFKSTTGKLRLIAD